MAPLYNKALIIGATSGIGEALAAKLVSEGTSVIVTGRRRERLDAFVSQHGKVAAPSGSAPVSVSSMVLDVTRLGEIPAFAAAVLREHPDLDCVVINAGVQRAYDFARPETVDLDGSFTDELTTNYLAPVHLTKAFLPHLQNLAKRSKGGEGGGGSTTTHLVYISASLGLIPGLLRTPGYNASKAALHSFVMNVREQLRQADAEAGQGSVRLVEVFPPAVQTELHDERHQPDLRGGGALGMPLDEFTERAYSGLVRGDDQFAIGPAESLLAPGGWEDQRQALFHKQHVALSELISKYLK